MIRERITIPYSFVQVLFLITKNNPPQLNGGNFSRVSYTNLCARVNGQFHDVKHLILAKMCFAAYFHISKAFKEFVDICLNKEASSRPSAKDLLNHHFIRR